MQCRSSKFRLTRGFSTAVRPVYAFRSLVANAFFASIVIHDSVGTGDLNVSFSCPNSNDSSFRGLCAQSNSLVDFLGRLLCVTIGVVIGARGDRVSRFILVVRRWRLGRRLGLGFSLRLGFGRGSCFCRAARRASPSDTGLLLVRCGCRHEIAPDTRGLLDIFC